MPSGDQVFFIEACACFQTGCMQVVRDLISKKFVPDDPTGITITITSGYRNPTINALTPGAAPNSMHLWRLGEGMSFLTANDFVIDGSKADPEKVFEYLKSVLGGYCELIFYPQDKHFHISFSLKKEPFAK